MTKPKTYLDMIKTAVYDLDQHFSKGSSVPAITKYLEEEEDVRNSVLSLFIHCVLEAGRYSSIASSKRGEMPLQETSCPFVCALDMIRSIIDGHGTKVCIVVKI